MPSFRAAARDSSPIAPPKRLPQTISHPRCSRITSSIILFTVSGLSSSSLVRSSSSTLARSAGMSMPAPIIFRSRGSISASSPVVNWMMMVRRMSLPAILIIMPNGPSLSLSISRSIASRPSSDSANPANRAAKSGPPPRPPCSLKNRRRYSSSKKWAIIRSLMAARISRKRLGMTPDPHSRGTLSKSILTASQLVMPPANPNSPAARIQGPTSLQAEPAAAWLLAMTPATSRANEARLLTRPFSIPPLIAAWKCPCGPGGAAGPARSAGRSARGS